MFRVWVEYRDGYVEYYDYVTKNFWFNYLYNKLEKDDDVIHYDVETIQEDENEG